MISIYALRKKLKTLNFCLLFAHTISWIQFTFILCEIHIYEDFRTCLYETFNSVVQINSFSFNLPAKSFKQQNNSTESVLEAKYKSSMRFTDN